MATKQQAVETLRRKLGDEAYEDERTQLRGGSDHDRELLLAFSNELKLRREDYGWHRHEKLLRHLVRMSEHADAALAASLETERAEASEDARFEAAKDAAKVVVRWIHDTYDIDDGSQETNRDYRVAFRMFARHVTRGDDIPDTHEWISTKTSRNYDPAPDEADMLDLEDDVEPMIEATLNTRDAALHALQFEGGFRGGELYDLRLGDLTDGEHSLKVRVDGKRGEHDVHLITAVPWIQQWQRDHPGDEDDYLWTKLDEPKRVSYQQFLQCFRQPAARAGVTKPVTPTNFRKSNAYWLATRNKSQAFIEDRQGRSRGSPVIARYVAAFSGETRERQYAAMHGLDVDVEEESVDAPVRCPRCEKQTPADRGFCLNCSFALDFESKELVDAVTHTMEEQAIEEPDADRRRDLLTASRGIRENPAAVDDEELHSALASLSSDSSESG